MGTQGPRDSRRSARRLVDADLQPWQLVFARARWGVAIAHANNDTLDRVNQTFAEMHGYTVEELQGRKIADVFPADKRPFVVEHMRRVLRDGQFTFESVHLRKDGSTFPVLVDACVVRDAEGHQLYRAAHVQDITERKRIEDELRFKTAVLQTQQEASLDGILVVDGDGKIVSYNQRFARMWQLPDEMLKRRCDNLALEIAVERVADPDGFLARVRYLYDNPEESSTDQLEMKDGRIFDRYSAPLVGTDGQRYGRVWYFRDITDRIQAEAALREQVASRRRIATLTEEKVYLQEQIRNEFGFEEIVGSSKAMQDVAVAVQQVAATDATVLLTGETGTGKELVARAIHKLSGRHHKLLVKVNCAALPATLVESELFGHEKGAFTGALQRKPGRFQLADGGTIFLDEIGDLPLELQAKLLRVLQEGEFERVGGTETIRVNVRVVAASNKDLEDEVARERFRSDLYYRLNVFPIRLPPLREREGDIRLLARHFTLKHASRLGKRLDAIPEAMLRELEVYAWPGNVRELQNIIERAVILTRDSTLKLGGTLPRSGGLRAVPDSLSLEDVERRHIEWVLGQVGGRISGAGGAAELLGLKRSTLVSRMKKLGVRRPAVD